MCSPSGETEILSKTLQQPVFLSEKFHVHPFQKTKTPTEVFHIEQTVDAEFCRMLDSDWSEDLSDSSAGANNTFILNSLF